MRLQAPALLAAVATLAATCLLLPTVSWATAVPWQIGQQAPATPIMERVHSFHDMLMWIISAIVIFVLALLALRLLAVRREPEPGAVATLAPPDCSR